MLKKKKFKKSFKLLSVLLSVVLLLFSIPTSALAADENNISESLMESVVPNVPSDDYVYDSREFFSDETVGVTEAIERREENVKHFILPDGTYQAVTYVNAVHRMDSDGVWQDINNNLYLQGTGGSAAYVTSDSRVHFSKNAPVITVSENGYTVKMTYMTAPVPGNENISAEETVFLGMTSSVTNAEVRAEKYDTLDAALIIDNKSRMAYNSVKSGMNIEYELNGNNVKENIIVNSSSDIYEYIFRLDLTGLTAELADGGYILIKDETSGKVEYRIPAPYMYDAEGKISYDVAYELVAVKNGVYLLGITADETWINSEDRAFPVTIDPTIIADNVFLDTYVDSSDPSATHGYDDNMLLNSSTTAMVRIDLPAIPTNSVINAVQLNMYAYDNREEGDIVLGVYPILDSWIETNACYNNIPPIGTEAITTETVYLNMESSLYSPIGISFTVTDYIASFYEVTGGEYSGMAIRRLSGVSSGNLVSSNFDYGMYGAFLTINYSFDITNGVFAIHPVQSNTNWLTVQPSADGIVDIESNIQQKSVGTVTTLMNNFDRSCLFKISKVYGTDRYIIRSMLDNTVSIAVSGNSVVTRRIPNYDGNVPEAWTFHLEGDSNGFTIRPYGSTSVLYLSSTTSTNLTVIDNSSTSTGKYWVLEKYTGVSRGGYSFVRKGSHIAGNTVEWDIYSWSTLISHNTAHISLVGGNTGIASLTWDWDNQSGSVAIHDEGSFDVNVKVGTYDLTSCNISVETITTELPVAEGMYFFKNAEYSAYMQIDNNESSPTNNGAIFELWQFDGANDQRWNVDHILDGYYKLESVAGGKVATAPSNIDGSVTQTAYSGAYNQQWKFAINTNGSVKLKPRSSLENFLAAGDGIFTSDGRNVELRSNQSDGKDEWNIYKKRDYSLMFIGYEDGDVSMPPILNSVSSALQNNALMEGYAYTSMNKADVLMYMSSSSIFSCITHGSQTSILTSDGELNISDINALDNGAFNNLEFVYMGACETGKGAVGGANLVNAVYSKGADTVLGFTISVYVEETNLWTETFMIELSKGKTIDEAMNIADNVVSTSEYLAVPYFSTSAQYRYVVGSTQVSPCSN